MIKNHTEALIARPFYASPHYTYEKLLDASTILNHKRTPYTTLRTMNDLEGLCIRR